MRREKGERSARGGEKGDLFCSVVVRFVRVFHIVYLPINLLEEIETMKTHRAYSIWGTHEARVPIMVLMPPEEQAPQRAQTLRNIHPLQPSTHPATALRSTQRCVSLPQLTRLRLEHVHDCEESGRWPAIAKITALDQIASSFAGYETHLRGGSCTRGRSAEGWVLRWYIDSGRTMTDSGASPIHWALRA